jgi:hypothetical protein
MRIRLHGTPDEIERTLAKLALILDVTDIGRVCHDRAPSKLVRLYLQVDLSSVRKAGEPATGRAFSPVR